MTDDPYLWDRSEPADVELVLVPMKTAAAPIIQQPVGSDEPMK